LEEAQLKKYAKKVGVIGSFFLVALLFYWLGWRRALVAYALVAAAIMVLMILVQSGRGGGLASLGGLDTDALFGTHSATPISKATYVLGILFIFICMLAVKLGTQGMGQGFTPPPPWEAPGARGTTRGAGAAAGTAQPGAEDQLPHSGAQTREEGK